MIALLGRLCGGNESIKLKDGTSVYCYVPIGSDPGPKESRYDFLDRQGESTGSGNVFISHYVERGRVRPYQWSTCGGYPWYTTPYGPMVPGTIISNDVPWTELHSNEAASMQDKSARRDYFRIRQNDVCVAIDHFGCYPSSGYSSFGTNIVWKKPYRVCGDWSAQYIYGHEIHRRGDGRIDFSESLYGSLPTSIPNKPNYRSADYVVWYTSTSTSSAVVDEVAYNYWLNRVSDVPMVNWTSQLNSARFSEAFYKAIEKLPNLKQNMIANVISTVSSIKNIFSKWEKTVFDKDLVSNAWLAYRYEYNTTVSDMQEVESCLERLYQLSQDKTAVITSYGGCSDGVYTYHASVEVHLWELFPHDVTELLTFLNARVTATNVWDMIPFSFIVDWFTDFGTLVSSLDQWLDAAEMPIRNVWYSVTSEPHQADRGEVSTYFRFKGNPPSLPYVHLDTSSSNKTIVMRVMDTLALFF